MNEMFLLYLLTRLDIIVCAAIWILAIGGTLWGIALMATCDSFLFDDGAAARKKLWPFWKLFALCIAVLVITPSQKDAMFIIAGTGVIEAAKSDTAQRLANKSVNVVEKYLDEMLKEEKK